MRKVRVCETLAMRNTSFALCLLVASATITVGVFGGANEPRARLMAVTVDDLPVAQPSWHTSEQMDRITTDLLATFSEHGVPAVGFVNEGKLEVDGRSIPYGSDPGTVAERRSRARQPRIRSP